MAASRAAAAQRLRSAEGPLPALTQNDIVEMIFFPVVNEACRCLAEGVVPNEYGTHPQSKLRGPSSLAFGEDLKIQNSALNHSVLVPQSLFDIDNDDYDR